ncbi:MAG: cation-transporting P-type ATPase [Anaerolineales bacterium]
MKIHARSKKTIISSSGTESTTNQSELSKLPIDKLETVLKATSKGLNQAEAKQRLTQYGYNEISEAKTNPYLKFLSYFWGPIPWMIEVAAVLSILVHHWTDLVIILVFNQ